MVSEYLTPASGGNLRLPANTPLHKQPHEPDGDTFTECTELFEPKEGKWWSSMHMVWQLQNLAIPLFEACWPNHQAVFLFDNATNHTAFAHDALRVSSMNLSSGGNENHDMRDGWNPRTQEAQPIYILVRGRKVAKGMEAVLEERGLWRHGKLVPNLAFKLELTATGIGLSLHCQIDNPDPSRKSKRVPNPQCLQGGECCATEILSAQDDFRSTRSRLQEIVEDAGHIFLLYLKFHCELNWIE